MSYVGMFLGGSPGALIASGYAQLNLQWQAENREDVKGASFTVVGPGVNQTIQADASGRAYAVVPVGDYTVSVTHAGSYLADDPLTVHAESQKSYVVFFNGEIDHTAEFREGLNGKLGKTETAMRAISDENGDNIANTYEKKTSPFTEYNGPLEDIFEKKGTTGPFILKYDLELENIPNDSASQFGYYRAGMVLNTSDSGGFKYIASLKCGDLEGLSIIVTKKFNPVSYSTEYKINPSVTVYLKR